MNPHNPYSLIAKKRETLSFPAKYLLSKNLLSVDVPDLGCSFGKDVEVLKEKNICITGCDEYHAPAYPQKKFNTIICLYMLIVLLHEEQAIALTETSQLVKLKGKGYIAVRRDLRFDEGFRTHKLYNKKT
jgi:hypothetical protein